MRYATTIAGPTSGSTTKQTASKTIRGAVPAARRRGDCSHPVAGRAEAPSLKTVSTTHASMALGRMILDPRESGPDPAFGLARLRAASSMSTEVPLQGERERRGPPDAVHVPRVPYLISRVGG